MTTIRREVSLREVFGPICPSGVAVRVDPGVFAPHPDTAPLVAWCAAALRRTPHPVAPDCVAPDCVAPDCVAPHAVAPHPVAPHAVAPRSVALDLCTGSGAIALALALTRSLAAPGLRVVAVDSSPAAVACARRNADRIRRGHGIDVDVRRGDVTSDAGAADLAGAVDLVVANPPYLPAGAAVDPVVAGGVEPAALFAGGDGLDVIRGVVTVAAGVLASGGLLALEHAAGQDAAVVAIVAAAGAFTEVTRHRNARGSGGFVTARRLCAVQGIRGQIPCTPHTRRDPDPMETPNMTYS